jgi:hypothetical protein
VISRQLPALKEIVGHESICENIVTLTRCDWSGPASAKLDARHFFWRPKVKLQIRTSCSLRSGLLFSEALGPVPVLKVLIVLGTGRFFGGFGTCPRFEGSGVGGQRIGGGGRWVLGCGGWGTGSRRVSLYLGALLGVGLAGFWVEKDFGNIQVAPSYVGDAS